MELCEEREETDEVGECEEREETDEVGEPKREEVVEEGVETVETGDEEVGYAEWS